MWINIAIIIHMRRLIVKTVQMTLDEDLIEEVDKITRELKTTRSAFTRKVLKEAVKQFRIQRMEEQHRKGYMRHPVCNDEFSVWEDEQEWGD